MFFLRRHCEGTYAKRDQRDLFALDDAATWRSTRNLELVGT